MSLSICRYTILTAWNCFSIQSFPSATSDGFSILTVGHNPFMLRSENCDHFAFPGPEILAIEYAVLFFRRRHLCMGPFSTTHFPQIAPGVWPKMY